MYLVRKPSENSILQKEKNESSCHIRRDVSLLFICICEVPALAVLCIKPVKEAWLASNPK